MGIARRRRTHRRAARRPPQVRDEGLEAYLAEARRVLRDAAGNTELLEGWEPRLRRYHADGVTAHAAVVRLLDEAGFFEDD